MRSEKRKAKYTNFLVVRASCGADLRSATDSSAAPSRVFLCGAYHHSSQRRTAPDRRTTSARCPEAWSMLSLLSFDTSLQNLDCVLV